YMNRQYLDPVLRGAYPDELPEMFGEAWPRFPSSDLETIAQRVDFVGINYYKRGVTKYDPNTIVERATRVNPPHSVYTETDWEVHAPSLTKILLWFRDRYGAMPLFITENGAAFYDPPAAIGDVVEDPLRVQYLRDHIAALGGAMSAGVDVRGYFVWSLLDNLEWSLGYTKRFGIVHVDFATQKRTRKRSAAAYREVIRNRGL